MQLPFIIIFDIDNCIIGNIHNCTHEQGIIDILYKNCKKDKITNVCVNKTIDITNELKEGLLRPNLKDFVEFCKKKYKNVELFLYTNSSYKWTNTTLVYNIEKASKIKFNKPYFTRENSNNNKKLISNIYDDIIKVLSKKYPQLSKDINKETVFNTRLMMIDDIPNNIQDFSNKQIVCPEYNYRPYYNIEEKIINKYKIPEKLFNDKEILDYFDYNFLPIYNMNGNYLQKDKTILNIIELYNTRLSELNNKVPDTFFNDLIKILEKKDIIMNDKNIEKINKEIQNLSK